MTPAHQDYESQIENQEELMGNDIKINPDWYIHNAILKAQEALANADIKLGHMQFRVLVEHIETLCRAASMLPDNYDTKLEEYKKSEPYTRTRLDLQEIKEAHKKLELLLGEVFSAKTNTTPMKIGPRRYEKGRK